MHRTEIIQRCNENIKRVNQIQKKEEIHPLIKKMTEALYQRINTIMEICSVEKYNLCLMGEVGVGKSTAIVNLFGLTDEEHFQEGKNLSDIPLFKTATGRTTLCRTEVCFTETDDIKIEIEAKSKEEVKAIVRDFCLKTVKDGEGKKSGKTSEEIDCSIEVQRAIRNMSGCPEELEELDEYINQTLGNQEISEENRIDFLQKSILKQINYDERTKMEILCTDSKNWEKWLKTNFLELNQGKKKDMPYPNKITVILNKKDTELKIPDYIHKIVDTRGIDGEGVRRDLTDMCGDKENICILCDKIATYGNIVSQTFFKNIFNSTNQDLKYRNFVMGLERGTELCEVNEAEGREQGKDKKKEEALGIWKSENLFLDEKNMMFYNALFGIEYTSKRKIIEIDAQEYRYEIDRILSFIERKIGDMYEEYRDELKEIREKLEIFDKNKIEEFHKTKLMEVRSTVESSLKSAENHFDLLFRNLFDDICKKINAGCIRASVSRNGVYENYNLYDEVKNISYKEFDETVKSRYYHITERIKELFEENDGIESALQTALEYKVDELYEGRRENNATDYEKTVRRHLLKDTIWKVMEDYWGNTTKDCTYREKVAKTLLARIEEINFIDEIIKVNNAKGFFEDCIQFLDVN